jgi:hypothetical protein
MKGKRILPGEDPLLDEALAKPKKGLKKGEDPFFYDVNAHDTSVPGARARTRSAEQSEDPPATESVRDEAERADDGAPRGSRPSAERGRPRWVTVVWAAGLAVLTAVIVFLLLGRPTSNVATAPATSAVVAPSAATALPAATVAQPPRVAVDEPSQPVAASARPGSTPAPRTTKESATPKTSPRVQAQESAPISAPTQVPSSEPRPRAGVFTALPE